MRRSLEQAHGGIYRYTSKVEMDRMFDRAYRKIDHPMTDLEFWRLIAPVVAHITRSHLHLVSKIVANTVRDAHALLSSSARCACWQAG